MNVLQKNLNMHSVFRTEKRYEKSVAKISMKNHMEKVCGCRQIFHTFLNFGKIFSSSMPSSLL